MGIKANVEEIKRQRLLKGWSNEELAFQSGRSLKTVESIQRGGSVLPSTLRDIAEALGVSIQSIMEGELPEKPKEDRVRITIELPIPFSNCDETIDAERVIAALSMLLRQSHSIELVNVVSGSVLTRSDRVAGHTNIPAQSTSNVSTFVLEMSETEASELYNYVFDLNATNGNHRQMLLHGKRLPDDEYYDLTKIATKIEVFNRVFDIPKRS